MSARAPETPAIDPAASEAEVARALVRTSVYRVLSLATAYPTAARLAELARAAGTVRTQPAVPADVTEALAGLGAAAEAAGAGDVAREYVFLFDGAVRCPPYEGAYGPPTMAGKGAALADISGFYSAFGVAPGDGADAEVQDHVAAQLEFMSVLALKEAWACAGADAGRAAVARDAQVAFLRDHLGRWAASFAATLRATTTTTYYTAVADALTAWIRVETAALGVEPAPAAGPVAADDAEPFTCPLAPE